MIKNKIFSIIGAIFAYIFILVCIFWFRIDDIFIRYGMPDMDTDSTIWNYARDFTLYSSIPNRIVDSYWSFPLGYKWSGSPYAYDYVVDFINTIFHFSGSNLKILMLLVNLNVLVTYVLTALFSFLLLRKYTEYQILAFFGGMLIGFGYYQLLYAKGSMSINNFWVIPLFYYFFVSFIRNKTTLNAGICIVLIAIVAGISPYWAFYILLFSPIFVLHEGFKKRDIKIYFLLYILFAGSIILGNLNYFLLNKDFLSAAKMESVGRVGAYFEPISEMVPSISGFFIELRGEGYDWNRLRGFSLGYVLLVGLFFTFFQKGFLFRNKYLYISLFLGVALYFYTPATYFLNELYFQFFGAFKGVLRLHIIVTLIAMIIIVLFLNEYIKTIEKNRKKYVCALIVIGILSFFQLYRNVPLYEKTWNHQTDFSKINNVYSLLQNEKINSVLFYPTYLDNVIAEGFGGVPNQQSLSQVIHGKPIVGGIDIKSNTPQEHKKYFENISNFHNSQGEFDIQKLKSTMREYGINTFVVFNRKLKNSESINMLLQNDDDFVFLGRRTEAYDDENYLSLKDSSMDISVYLYQDLPVKFIGEYNIGDKKGKMESIGINTYKIQLNSDLKKGDIIEIVLPKDDKWNLQLVKKAEHIDFFWLLKNRENNVFEKKKTQFFNAWTVSEDVYNEYDVIITYAGDNKYIYALFISAFYYGVIFLFIIFLGTRKFLKQRKE